METLQIKKADAVKALHSATPEVRDMLITLFGKQLSTKITDRVKTFDDVLSIKGISLDELINDDNLLKDEIAYRKAKLIAEVYNEGEILDWGNSKQVKYFPWFEWEPGFGLSYGDCGYWNSNAIVGSRLCFKSSELAIDAGKKFTDIYNDLLN